ncbi:MAG: zinc ribbon domain-containing protein [Sandaracinaceae bacterium]|nr:zinc ribbon domain-containing protein [Sandaracinaceae bacterium]
MNDVIPWFFLTLAAAGLLTALFFLWQSIRAALGVVEVGVGDNADRDRARLLERKAALVDGIADLRFEHDAGKITTEDFAVVDAQMRAEAKEVLRALDEELTPYRAEAERLIEAHLAGSSLSSDASGLLSGDGDAEGADTRRASSRPPARRASVPAPGEADADAAAPPRRRRSRPSASDSGSRDNHLLCPQCMAPNVPEAEFCVECQARVAPLPCGACETVNDADATFCKKCGAALSARDGVEGRPS